MKKRIILAIVLAVVMTLSIVALVACDNQPQEEHKCQHVCPVEGCGKCLDKDCEDPACADKCPGHQVAPGHECKHVCPECHKCLDKDCEDPVCADKCPGHDPVVECDHEAIAFVEAVEPSCEAAGVAAHWYCDECGKFFAADEDGEEGEVGEEIAEADTVVAALPHTWENEELTAEVPASCTQEGKMAYRFCTVCEKYYDEEDALIGDSEEDLVIAMLPHNFDTESVNEESWLWPEAYEASILTAGIKLSVECTVCNESYEVDATVSKVEEKCTEPTYVDKGSYVLVASANVGEEVLISGEKTYEVPELPDGNPNQSYYLLGTLNNVNCWSNSATRLFKWNKEIQAYQLDMSFYANDEWKVRLGSTWDTQYDGSSMVVSYAEGVEAPTAKELFTNLSGGNIKTAYACTVTITLDLTAAHKMYILVKSVDLTEVVAEYWVYGSMNSWGANDNYKFASNGDGTYKLTVTFATGAEFKIFGAGSWFGLGSENTIRLTNNSTGSMTFAGTDNIKVTGSGTVTLVWNPEARTLVITDAE